MTELFVPMYPDGTFAIGGGSSTPSHIRAFNNRLSAERSARQLPTKEAVWNRELGGYEYVELGEVSVVKFVAVEE